MQLLRADADEVTLPFDRSERPQETLLNVPGDSSTENNIVIAETHPAIPRPATLVVADNVVRRVGIGTEVSLDEVARQLYSKAEEEMDTVDVR